MPSAFSVFVSGIGGVFAGMALLYLTMKLTALAMGAFPAESDEPGKSP